MRVIASRPFFSLGYIASAMVDSSQPPASRRVVGPAQSGDAEADSVKDGGGGGGDGGGGDKTPDPQVPTESTGTTTSKLATTIISSSSSASSDDSPLPSPTLGDSEPARTLRKDKSRVRFNSDACWPGDPQLDPREARRGSEPNLPLRQPKHGSSRPRPRPLGVLRSHSSNLLPSSSSAQEPHRGVELERAVSAAAANWRAGNFSGSVQWGDNSAREPSDQHAPERTDARDGEGPRECEPEGSIQLHETVINGGNQSAEGHENPEHVNHELYRHLVEQQAQHLVWCHTRRFHDATGHVDARGRGQAETTTPTQAEEGHAGPTEVDEGPDDMNDVPPPSQYRASVLSQLLRLYKPTPDAVMTSHTRNWSASTLANTSSSSADDGGERRPNPSLSGGTWSGSTTPPRRKWYNGNRSHDTLANLVEASKRLAHPNPASSPEGGKPTGRPGARRDSEGGRRSSSATTLQQRDDEEASVTVQIADTLVRQEYIVSLCRALMLYGAPSHRLEEYLSMKARFLKIDGQFLYLPGSMVISFDDRSTHTTEVRMVRSAQGIDLGRLKDVHRIYKEVIHNVMDVEEGRERLDKLMNSRDRVHPWLRVVAFGLTSAACATFSFRARLIDLPLCFCLGCLVGFLQIIVAPRSKMYNNVFEVSAVILVSFLSRAFGSIAGGSLFCFSAMAQSSIVILLPGYLVCESPSSQQYPSLASPWGKMLTRCDTSVLGSRDPVSSHCPWVDSHRIRHRLLAASRLWHNHRRRSLRHSGRECHIRHDVYRPLVTLHRLCICAGLCRVHKHVLSGAAVPGARHDCCRLCRACRQLLQQPQALGQPADS